MKTSNYLPVLLLIAANSLFSQSNIQQPTSINPDGTTPAASAMLEVSATDKGILVPRMTSAQRTAITAPAAGLLVFDIDTGGFWFYYGGWQSLSGGSYTEGAGISISGGIISNTGDINAADDLTTGSTASGDVTGLFSNLQIAPGAVGTSKLSNNAVTSGKILDGTILAADLAPGVIPTSLPPSGTAGGDLSGTYPNPTIAAGVVGTTKLANNSVTDVKISSGVATNGQVLTANGSGGAAWVSPAGGGGIPNKIQDADTDTKIQVEKIVDEDIIRFDLAGTERMVLGKNASGTPRLELKDALSSTFIGTNAGAANTTGFSNVGIGVGTLYSNTTGNYNTASGANALYLNTTGAQNTAIGNDALGFNSTGSSNTANGFYALEVV